MRRRRTIVTAGCVAGAIVVGGCATPGYDTGRIERELVQAGTTPAQAHCITNGMSNQFDERQLASHSEPSAQRPAPNQESEVELMRDILHKCRVTLPLNPLP